MHFDGTTILAVRKNGSTAMAGDGQVTFGSAILKNDARKIRKIYNDEILVGFAGSTADAFSLFEKFEVFLEKYHGEIQRAAVELAKQWRNDKILRRLEAMLLVGSKDYLYLISGNGDVIEPERDSVAIGSGGSYAYAASLALEETALSAEDIARKSLEIAADICIYTNNRIRVEVLK